VLTDLACRKAQSRDKPWKVSDGRGLYLEILPSGFKSWRWKYRIGGKEKRLVFGPYPEIGLTQARDMRIEAARMLLQGRDPAIEKKKLLAARATSIATTFGGIAEEWMGQQSPLWSPRYASIVRSSFDRDVLPRLGKLPVAEVTAPLVLEVVRSIEARGAIETARRTRQRIEEIFAVAIALGSASSNPAAGLATVIAKPKRGRFPAVRTVSKARQVLKTVEALPQHPLTRIASRLLALTAVRSAPLRLSTRDEFEDLDGPAPLWRIPAAKMKLSVERKDDAALEFLVPLSRQAVELVKLAIAQTPRAQLLFPSMRGWRRPMSDSTLSKAYREAGWSGVHVPHGWRSTFSTIMNERAVEDERAADRAIIDLMLAHVPSGIEATYNRAAYMPRRRALAQDWADLLLEGFPPAATLIEGKRQH
jgi:integrase